MLDVFGPFIASVLLYLPTLLFDLYDPTSEARDTRLFVGKDAVVAKSLAFACL